MNECYKFRAVCLVCNHRETVHAENKKGSKEVMVCPKCKGAFVDAYRAHQYTQPQSNEIEVIMSSVNEAPKIKVNVKEISGIIILDYKYVTSDLKSKGYHNFTVRYCDKETNTIRTVSANKIWEG